MKCQRSRRTIGTGFRVWVCPFGLGSKSATKAKKTQHPNYLKQIQNCRSQQHKWCVSQVCVCECVCVWDVGVVGNSASCATNQLMMLLTLPQPAELDKQQQQLSEKRGWSDRGEGSGAWVPESQPIGCLHWMSRAGAQFSRDTSIFDKSSLSLSLCIACFPLLSLFSSSSSSFFFAGVSFCVLFLYSSWILLHSCICFVSQLLMIAPNGV